MDFTISYDFSERGVAPVFNELLLLFVIVDVLPSLPLTSLSPVKL